MTMMKFFFLPVVGARLVLKRGGADVVEALADNLDMHVPRIVKGVTKRATDQQQQVQQTRVAPTPFIWTGEGARTVYAGAAAFNQGAKIGGAGIAGGAVAGWGHGVKMVKKLQQADLEGAVNQGLRAADDVHSTFDPLFKHSVHIFYKRPLRINQ